MRKLMIVDDHENLLNTLAYALQEEYEIATANNAWDCMLQLPLFKPEVLLLDYKLPDINGLDLLEQIMQTPYPPEVILFSSAMDRNLAEEARQLGARYCLGKPFEITELKEKLAALNA